MASLPWFRMYNETLSDRKLKLVSIETGIPKVVILGAWTGLLILASESPERGVLLTGSGKPLPVDFMADEIGIDSSDLSAILDCFEEMAMIHKGIDNVVVIANWSERQFKSDDSYARVKKFRQKQQIEGDDYEKRFKKPKRNVSRNGPDTDTESYTESKIKDSPKGGDKSPSQQMFSALAHIWGVDINNLTKDERGKLNQNEKKLREMGARASELKEFYAYWQAKGNRPRKWKSCEVIEPDMVREGYKRYCNWLKDRTRFSTEAELPEAITDLAQEILDKAEALQPGYSNVLHGMRLIANNGHFEVANPSESQREWLEARDYKLVKALQQAAAEVGAEVVYP